MTKTLRWRLTGAVALLLAASAVALPVQAAPGSALSLTDIVNDVVTYDSQAPYNVPAADIIASTASYKPTEITFTMKTAEPSDPRTTLNWDSQATAASWRIRKAGSGQGFDYELRYQKIAGAITGKVYSGLDTNHTAPLCSATMATFSDKTYRSAIDPACIGKPESFSYAATIVYDTNPADINAPEATDGPDGGVFSSVLTRPVMGYWLVGRDGGIFSFGDAAFKGSTGAMTLNQPIVGMAADPDGSGYWFVAADGGVFAFDAPFLGSMGGTKLNKPIVGMAATPSGQGYWLVASDGGIFAFGDALFKGSTGAMKLNKPIVGMAPANSRGYWLVASDGGIFAFGNSAKFFGSTGALKLNQPIVGMASLPSDKGYWFVASDGGIFSFGEAEFYGADLGGAPVTGMTAAPDGKGYWVTRADGKVKGYGSATTLGGLTQAPNSPVVGMATMQVPAATAARS